MRVGMNPQKVIKKAEMKFYHRLIIVVFIPSLDGYYKDVFDVFKLCIESALATKNNKCGITIVNNACCKEVVNYLNNLYHSANIDNLIHHKSNLGKMDALIGAARGCREPLITLSDVDILFKQGWQEAVEEIFSKINGVGSVSPIAARKYLRYGTVSTIQKIFLKQVDLKFKSIPENFKDHNRNLACTNWKLDEHNQLKWPVITKNNTKAIQGSPHQVLTIRRELLYSNVPFKPSLTLVGNKSEYLYCDLPIDMSGGMRLATYRNFAYHMGNKLDKWMLKAQEKNKELINKKPLPRDTLDLPKFKTKTPSIYYYKLKRRFLIKLFNIFYAKKQNN